MDGDYYRQNGLGVMHIYKLKKKNARRNGQKRAAVTGARGESSFHNSKSL